MSKKRGGGYDIGYGKPPKDKRFKKGGPSPNPHGRPPKKETFYTAVLRHLSQEIKVTTADGEVRDIEKRDLIAERVVQKAAMGDIQAIKIISQIDEGYVHHEAQQAAEEEAKTQSLPPITELIESLYDRRNINRDLKDEILYCQHENGEIHPTTMGQTFIDLTQALRAGHIKTVEAYKPAINRLLDAIDEMALGYLVQWNPDLKKSDLA